MTNQVANTLVNDLHWRYATKKFDSQRKIPAQDWTQIQEALVLSPSSFGLQPYKFIVVTDQKIKEQLVPHSWNQTQPVGCSHLVVFARLATIDEDYVSKYIDRIVEVRNVPAESIKEYAGMMTGFINRLTPEQLADWMTKQCYIALGNLMTVASSLKVDNCPMEGFVATEYDKVLGLEKLGVTSVVVCALGYRDQNDKYANVPKVRFPDSELIVNI